MANFPCEAIVNATTTLMVLNTSARHGTEFRIVDGAGDKLSQYLYNLRPRGLRIGDAIISPSFRLTNCYHIIHTNGPNYKDKFHGSRALIKQQLADCYRRCLEEAFESKAQNIAFPSISTGHSLKWPRESAARIGVTTVRAWFRHPIHGGKRRERIKRVYFLADPLGPNSRQERAWYVLREQVSSYWGECLKRNSSWASSPFKTFSLGTCLGSNNSKFLPEEVIANSPLPDRVEAFE
jgi:O-acetyl-ADP-ribose deacetylase (regulator of RNase III)